MLVELLVVDEFAIRQIRTPEELDLACQFLLRIFSSRDPGWPGARFFRERLADQSPVMLAARRGQEIAGVAFGHVEGGGLGTVDQLAVAAAVRGRGLGRRLLAALESGARSLGVRELTLGSIDGAVGFYQRCGYRGRLLLQFVPPRAATTSSRSSPTSRSWRHSGRTSPSSGCKRRQSTSPWPIASGAATASTRNG